MFNQDKVIVVNLEGIIMGGAGSSDGIINKTKGSDHILKILKDASEDKKIKGVLLRINSSGGTASASQEIYELIELVRAKEKPVIASMADIATSGGYLVSSACNRIIASPSTLTGSIGVIMQLPYYKELAEKIGVSFRTIKSGKLKDMGNPMRELTSEEQTLLDNMAKAVHEEFIELVAKGRNFDKEKIRNIADGRILTGRQAYELGLVDRLGNYYTAVDEMKTILKNDNIKFVDVIKSKKGFNVSFNLDSLLDTFQAFSFFK